MERQSKEPRSLEAYCIGQGPPRAVAPFGGVGGFLLTLLSE
jgi:hypothetical protein